MLTNNKSKTPDSITDIVLYRRLLSYVIPYWRVFLLSIISMIILAATDPAIAALMQKLMNGAFIEGEPEAIALMPFLFITLFVLRGVLSYVGNSAIHWVGNKVIMDIRQEMFNRFIDFPTSYFDSNRSGNVVSYFTHNITLIKEASTNAITTLIKDSLSIIGLLCWMFYINWLLALICLLGAPITAIIMGFLKKRLRKTSVKMRDTMSDIHHIIGEVFHAQKIIKLYGGKEVEKKRLFEAINMHRIFSNKFSMTAVATSPLIQIISALIIALIIFLATNKSGIGSLDAGSFVSFFTALSILMGSVKRLSCINEHIQKALSACDNVFAIIDADIERNNHKDELTNPEGKIEFSNVSYRYVGADRDALKDINIVISPGETVALIGESGSGKTTMANLIPRFYELKAGSILYDDKNILDLSLNSLRKNIAYVGQDIVLFNDTVRNNIAYGDLQNASDERVLAAVKAACATEFIDRLPEKINTIIGEDGVLLSGGQRQRLAIARALLRNSNLLILDEATSALDSKSEKQIQVALENVKKDRTCVIIAHRLSTIENADRIVVLNNGIIVEQGKHKDLLKLNKNYANLYKSQISQKKAID